MEGPASVARFHPGMIISCAAFWVLLWGDLSLANVLAGALLGALIGLVFPLPVTPGLGRFRPLGLIRLTIGLIIDLIRSSISVVFTVLRFGHLPRNAIIRVQLRSRSELHLALTAELVCLVPGTLVVEARRSTSTLYVHVLDVKGPADIEAAERTVLAAEAAAIRAFGRREEVAAVRSGTPMPVIGSPGTRDREGR